MTIWEYHVEKFHPDGSSYTLKCWLEDRGRDGWELIAIINRESIFKRPKAREPKEKREPKQNLEAFRVSPRERRELALLAKARGTTKSELLRALVREATHMGKPEVVK